MEDSPAPPLETARDVGTCRGRAGGRNGALLTSANDGNNINTQTVSATNRNAGSGQTERRVASNSTTLQNLTKMEKDN